MNLEFLSLTGIAARLPDKKLVIMTDSLIQKLYGASFPESPVVLIPQSEEAKSFDALQRALGQFATLGVDRSWHTLAIGGGSISDVAGFASHIWMRGIGCSFAPTTLLSMVDASLGGKNGIDFLGFKNSVGSFQEPERIFCDISTLHSLPKAQFASGMAEVIKHAIISGEPYFGMLESLGGLDLLTLGDKDLFEIVSGSQKIKSGIVRDDPLEQGNRRVLNLGHTFGHAVESATGLPHGHSISIGMLLACELSLRKGFLDESDYLRIRALLGKANLPKDLAELPRGLDPRAVASKLLMDKKRQDSEMHFVLPLSIGRVIVDRISVSHLELFLSEVLK
jgi:3-dehydroquinate synthase